MQSSHALLQLLPTGRHCRAKKWSSARIWARQRNPIDDRMIYNKQVQRKASDMLYHTDWNIGSNSLSTACNCHLSYKSQAHRLLSTVTSPHDAHFKVFCLFCLFFCFGQLENSCMQLLISLHHPLQAVSLQINCSPLSMAFSVWPLTSTSI